MKTIIDPVDVALIEAELTQDRFLRHTNKGNNEIYVVDAFNAPNVMREIGRLREIAFRAAGGGTGKDCDIDEFDTMPRPCQQLVVWNPQEKEILGGYRFILGEEMDFKADGTPNIAISHMFGYSRRFLDEFLPVTLELGRSFVRLEYQSTRVDFKSIYTLDNLWDGLGALTVVYPQIKYLLGKVTMYPSYSRECRDLLLTFLDAHFHDNDHMVWPLTPVERIFPASHFASIVEGKDFKEDYRRVNSFIRDLGYNIPPLVNAYMSLSPTMRMFGTAVNYEFGDVEETGILFKISEITEEKKGRHIGTFDTEESHYHE